MIRLDIFIFHQIAGLELVPAWPVHPQPGKVSEGSIRAECGPASAVDAFGVRTATGGVVRRGIDCSVRILFF